MMLLRWLRSWKEPAWLIAQTDKMRRHLRLIRRHHRALARSFGALVCIRYLLLTQSYRSALAWIEKRASGRRSAPISPDVAAWSVHHSARLVPGAACLAQALALRYLLTRGDIECLIRIGVKPDSGKGFGAHAWVIHEGRCILGGRDEDLSTFSKLVDL